MLPAKIFFLYSTLLRVVYVCVVHIFEKEGNKTLETVILS